MDKIATLSFDSETFEKFDLDIDAKDGYTYKLKITKEKVSGNTEKPLGKNNVANKAWEGLVLFTNSYMTTPIGDLPINSEGMRKLVDALDVNTIELRRRDKALEKANTLLGKLLSAKYTSHYDKELLAELISYWGTVS